MKITAKIPTELDVAFISITIPILYPDDETGIPADFPGREGNTIHMTLDIDARKVVGWPEGRTGSLDLKVSDQVEYDLAARDMSVIKTVKYCAPACIPGEYGDYVDMAIGADGTIAGWTPSPSQVGESFFPDDF